jgi:hypothetical protein
VVRETCFIRDIVSGDERSATEISGTFAPADVYGAAKTALLLAAGRRIEAALEAALGG